MPDIARVMREEIARLARKEVKAATEKLHKDNLQLKRTAAEHKRRIAKLERDNRQLLADAEKRREQAVKVSDEEVEGARITAKMIQATRKKLGLSQAELAALVEVNPFTVFQWEHKEGRLAFRGDTKAAIVEVRKLTKAEAAERLAAIKEKAGPRPKAKK